MTPTIHVTSCVDLGMMGGDAHRPAYFLLTIFYNLSKPDKRQPQRPYSRQLSYRRRPHNACWINVHGMIGLGADHKETLYG